jgi:hypothetical protein
MFARIHQAVLPTSLKTQLSCLQFFQTKIALDDIVFQDNNELFKNVR